MKLKNIELISVFLKNFRIPKSLQVLAFKLILKIPFKGRELSYIYKWLDPNFVLETLYSLYFSLASQVPNGLSPFKIRTAIFNTSKN